MKLPDKIDKKTLTRILIALSIIIFAIIIFSVLSSLKSPLKTSGQILPKFLIGISAEEGKHQIQETGYGTMESEFIIDVSPEVPGNLVYLNPFKPGDMVKQGDLLARIEKKDYQLNLEKADLKIQTCKAELESLEEIIEYDKGVLKSLSEQLKLQESDYNRSKQLFERSALSKRDSELAALSYFQTQKAYISGMTSLAEREFRMIVVKRTIEQSEIDKESAQLNLTRCDIVSPVSGRIKSVFVEQGENVTAGKPLVSIAQDDTMMVYVWLSATQVLNLIGDYDSATNGGKNWLKMPDYIKCKIYWTDFPEKFAWEGTVARVKDLNAKTSSVLLAVKPEKYIGTSERRKPLIEGMFCKVIFSGRTLENVVSLPWASLQLNGVIAVVDKDDIIREEPAKIISSSSSSLLVPYSFNEGDKIVVQQTPQGLVNGMKVKVSEIEKFW